jgi:hypothetical protein
VRLSSIQFGQQTPSPKFGEGQYLVASERPFASQYQRADRLRNTRPERMFRPRRSKFLTNCVRLSQDLSAAVSAT